MNSLKNIIAMLELVSQDHKDENVQIAKGKYKRPKSVREIYKVQKRHLKYRDNGRK